MVHDDKNKSTASDPVAPFLAGVDWRAHGAKPAEEWSEETKNAVRACAEAGFLDSWRATDEGKTAFAFRRIDRLEDELRRAVRVRDDFMSIASHELKTPVTALRLQLQLSRRGVNVETNLVPSAAKLTMILDMANRQVDRLSHLIEDLVDVAKIEAGKLQYDFGSTDLYALCEEVIARYADSVNQPRLIRGPENAPLFAVCDRHRIEQILTNLISNALKYGGERPAEVFLEQSGEKVRISVRDSGMGIPADRQPFIFDRFERAISYKYISGLGLGLFISRQIAEAHNGAISLVSKEGEGATFTLELPSQCAAARARA